MSTLDLAGIMRDLGAAAALIEIDSNPINVAIHRAALTAAEAIASEVAKALPGVPERDAWYAAGLGLMIRATLESATARQAPGSCHHAKLLATQANVSSLTAYRLIQRAGGDR